MPRYVRCDDETMRSRLTFMRDAGSDESLVEGLRHWDIYQCRSISMLKFGICSTTRTP